MQLQPCFRLDPAWKSEHFLQVPNAGNNPQLPLLLKGTSPPLSFPVPCLQLLCSPLSPGAELSSLAAQGGLSWEE